ncbi:MAG: b(o/a)3-type cytochrome-c oxidase subunit 1 [Halodesulfurarchaeum sp.]
MATQTADVSDFIDRFPAEAQVVRWNLIVAFVALFVGGLFGMLQALHRTGALRIVSSAQYYSLLTAHGVLLALVFTTFFIVGLFHWGVSRSLDRPAPNALYSKLWFAVMLLGTVLAAIPIVGGLLPFVSGIQADVLYTFYAPMKAHPLFYIGAALLIIGSWLAGADWFRNFLGWRSEHPGERIPLQTFMVLTTMLLWYLATLGVAIEVVFFLIPWSLGLIAEIDPLLTRTLFWFFGHPVVYFWLLPAYFVWYTILPKIAGGRLVSDPLARVSFLLFLLLSTPVGFHHQYLDPGVPAGFKFIAMTNTMFVLLPSFLTAFTVVASMEHGARQRGGGGVLGWLRALPWRNPTFSGIALAGLMFAAGGFSGMINAGMNINYMIHNTQWVPGHFHLTVGTAAALTFMAISYWLVPQVTGKRLQLRGLAAVQPYIWFVGMLLMSNAMHRAGLAGIPRRTAEPEWNMVEGVSYQPMFGSVQEMQIQIAVGGTLLFVSLFAFVVVMLGTFIVRRDLGPIRVEGSIPPALSGPEHGPRVLDNLRLWFAIAVVLVAIAYGPPLFDMVADGILEPGMPPITTGL